MKEMDRAQSEVLGNILLAGFILVGVSIAGVAYLAEIDTGGQPLVELAETGPDDQIELSHLGGDSLVPDQTRIVIQNESESVTVGLSDGTLEQTQPMDRLTPGGVWRYNVSDSGLTGPSVEVLVVVDDTVVFRGSKPESAL